MKLNPSKIIIATIIIFLFGSLLSGCGQGSDDSRAKNEGLRLAAEIKKDVTLKLSAKREGKTVTADIILENPFGRPITSVQSWLTFNPEQLMGMKVDTSKSPFTLTAPFESDFDQENGILRIGRANDKPVTLNTISLATITFELKGKGTTMVHAYDYKTDLSGHTSANILINNQPFNILQKPESPLLVIQN